MHEFVAIGETTIDAFIKLENADVNCDIDRKNCKICLPFAAKVPYEFVIEVPAVGNAGNASVAASRLGLKSALVANVGRDSDGEKCLGVLKTEGVSTEYVGIQEDKKTNYHYVLWYEDDRTILQKHSEFKYRLANEDEILFAIFYGLLGLPTVIPESTPGLYLIRESKPPKKLGEYFVKPGIPSGFRFPIF